MDNCIFCKIVKKEIPSKTIYEDDKMLAFHDIDPKAPVHVIIIPKQHICSLNDIDNINSHIVGHIFAVIPKLAKDLGITESGYRVVTNCGEDGGQSVPHLHYHILGGRKLSWPPG